MVNGTEKGRFIVDIKNLPESFPTHLHHGEFWEALGRTIATFGFLEEVLGKAIFSFTGTRKIPEDQIQIEFEKWLRTLQRALTDPLGDLITTYGKSVHNNPDATISNIDDLLKRLREAARVRNVIAHGSWRKPDANGRSLPLFIDRKLRVWATPIDSAYLKQVQKHVVELACTVVSTVTHMGWHFPGSRGPGNAIFPP